MKNILYLSIILVLISCTHINKNDQNTVFYEECRVHGELSKQCEIFNKNDFQSYEKFSALGFIYLFGLSGNQINYDKAFLYFNESAKHNYTEAFTGLGLIYANGLGQKKDFNLAEKYFLRAFELGDKDASNNLGGVFLENNDYSKAEYWFKKGINYNASRAYDGLSKTYIKMNNFKESFIYLKKAANLGNIEAEYNLGVFYEEGLYVDKDFVQAKYWYERAAMKGHLNAVKKIKVLGGD